MPVTIHEAFDSRAATVGKNDEATLRYIVQGTDDDTVVRNTVDATVPADYKGLDQQDYEMRPLGGTPGKEIWEVEVTYSNGTTQKEPERTQNPPQTGDSSFSFNTGGGTQHISQSLATIASYKAAANPNNPPDNKQAIGVHGDQVDGVDIVVPVLNFAEKRSCPQAIDRTSCYTHKSGICWIFADTTQSLTPAIPMPVFEHRNLPLLDIPRIRTRVLINAQRGAEQSEVWEQEMPADGHIPLHYHDVEEVLVLLSGAVELQLGDEVRQAQSPASVLIPAGQLHSLRPTTGEIVHLLAFFPCVSPNNFTPDGKPVRLPWQESMSAD